MSHTWRNVRFMCSVNIVCQIYDEYGRDGLAAFERGEMAKQMVGDPLKHPAEVRLRWVAFAFHSIRSFNFALRRRACPRSL